MNNALYMNLGNLYAGLSLADYNYPRQNLCETMKKWSRTL